MHGNPSAVRFNGSAASIPKPQSYEYEAYQRHERGDTRYPIQPFGYLDLLFPEGALYGFVIWVIAMWVSNRGIDLCNPIMHTGGWFVAVFGGCLFLLSVIPRFVELIAS